MRNTDGQGWVGEGDDVASGSVIQASPFLFENAHLVEGPVLAADLSGFSKLPLSRKTGSFIALDRRRVEVEDDEIDTVEAKLTKPDVQGPPHHLDAKARPPKQRLSDQDPAEGGGLVPAVDVGEFDVANDGIVMGTDHFVDLSRRGLLFRPA